MPVNKKQKLEELKKRADELHRAVSEFEKALFESGQEMKYIRQELAEIVNKQKMKKVLKKIINIKNN